MYISPTPSLRLLTHWAQTCKDVESAPSLNHTLNGGNEEDDIIPNITHHYRDCYPVYVQEVLLHAHRPLNEERQSVPSVPISSSEAAYQSPNAPFRSNPKE